MDAMKKTTLLFNSLTRTSVVAAALCISLCLQAAKPQDAEPQGVTQYVNPFLGTGSIDNASLKGSIFPGAAMPFGMVQLSPDTEELPWNDSASAYDYAHTTIYGFTHTHLSGTGCMDLDDVLLMPSTISADKYADTPGTYSCAFSHDNEKASPGYYAVTLNDGIKAELTATLRTGVHRYTFPTDKVGSLMIDLYHSGMMGNRKFNIIRSQLRLVDNKTIEGYRLIQGWVPLRKVYFRVELSQPVEKCIMKNGVHKLEGSDLVNGRNIKCFLQFAQSGEPLQAKVAISATSIENARANMSENKGLGFDKISNLARQAWEKELGNIRIDGTDDQKTIFYTGLYHAYLQPNIVSDLSGDYMRTDYTIARLPKGETHYSTFSLWDTFRAAHPLYTILKQERIADMVKSMLRQYDTYGYLPIWQLWGEENYCMIGNHAIPVMVDAALKHISGVDAEKVYEAVKGTSLRDHPNSPWSMIKQYGYIPDDSLGQSVSILLELCYDDACVARLAKALGKTDDYELFNKRSASWQNIYDPSTGFFRARMSDGSWKKPFSPLDYGDNGNTPYTEANAWQYLWSVQQDVPGMVKTFGGAKAFEAKLDSFFTLSERTSYTNGNASGFIGQYAHGNEPSHHVCYLYDYIGKPQKTAQFVNEVIDKYYGTGPGGMSGNDDCGQMSAWYVFSAMGFYPTDAANGRYDFGSPQLRKVTISLPDGKTFTITSDRKGKADYKIGKAVLNGRRLNRTYITHNEIMGGGTLRFYMKK